MEPSISFHKKNFYQLSLDELYAILKLRCAVFAVEQNCVYQDLDDNDQDAIHVWMCVGDEMVGYCRVLKANTYLDEIAIGRVLTTIRGKGYGLQLFRKAIDVAVFDFGAERIKIRAQVQAEPFYEKSGFVRCSEPFMYEELLHVDMLWHKDSRLV